MKINICTINHNERENERVTISYDTDERKLYADDEIIDTTELDTIEAAEDFCEASWGVDPMGVWELEWIEREEDGGEPATNYVVWTVKNGDQFNSKTYHNLADAREAAQMDVYHLTDAERKTRSVSIYGWSEYDPNGDPDAEWVDPEFVEDVLP